MTDKLLQSPLFEKIRNYLLEAEKSKQIFLYVPYIKSKVLAKLVDGLDNITIVTTWHTNDLLSGSSELDLYPFCKEHNYTLYVHNDIHLKVYSVGLDSAIVASGNISHGGLEGGNEECGVLVDKLSIQDRLFLEKIKANATFIDEEEYQRHLKLIEEKKEITPEIEKHPDLIITAKEEHFFKSSLPMTRSVDDLIKGYANMSSGLDASDEEETKACIIHDLGIYNLEQLGLSEDEFVAKLKVQFFSHPFIKKIEEFINPEAYWGRVREWVQENCKDDPIPRRWELTENTQTLYDWFVKLSDGKYIVDVPGARSERIRRIDIDSKLVLFSVSSDAAFEHYQNSIMNDVSTSNFSKSEMKKFANVRMWGAIDRIQNSNRRKWSKLKKDDILLFFREKKYVTMMILDGTEDNSDIAKMIWGEKTDHQTMNIEPKSGETWQLIMYATPDNVRQIDLDGIDLNKLLEYEENFPGPLRTFDFTVVAKERLDTLRRKYGSILKALESV
tara:strand:+ start:9426 stop:10928 length:1503 start_codon:yes stop_codon:yes gene_type:complete